MGPSRPREPRARYLLALTAFAAAALFVYVARAGAPKPPPDSAAPAPSALPAAQVLPPPAVKAAAPGVSGAPRAARIPQPVPAAPPASVPPAPRPGLLSVRIDSPTEGSVFHSRIELSGRIGLSEGSDLIARLESLRWSFKGTDRSGRIAVEPDGSFRAEVPTDGLKSALTLVVTARQKTGSPVQASVTLRDRGVGPSIIITSPSVPGAYGSRVAMKGTVQGPEELPNPLAEVASLSWGVDGTRLGGPLHFARDGVFEFSFSTVGFHGAITVRIRATDRNGHRSAALLVLPDRTAGPALAIDTPAEGSAYGAAVSVTGRAGDPDDPSGSPAEVSTLTWRILGHPSLSGTLPRESDGRFSLTFSTEGLRGTQKLELHAKDMNGRSSTAAVTLVQPEAPAPAAEQAPAPETPAVVAPHPSAPLEAAPEPTVPMPAAVQAPVREPPGTAPAVIAAAPSRAPHEEAPVVERAPEGPIPIVINSPAEGGYYKDITVIAGKVGSDAAPARLKSMTWEIPGHTDRQGRVVTGEDGAFKFPLYFSDLSGDVSVALVAEDLKGQVSRASLTLHDGRLKPVISLVSPAGGGSYGSLIRVAGTVTDPYAGLTGMEGVDSVGWLLAPVTFARSSAPIRGTIPLPPGGTFRFSLPTKSLTGTQDLTLSATGRSGNRTDLTIRLIQGNGDLPSFGVVPADRSLTVSWDQAAFAVRYDLSWSVDGAPADQASWKRDVKPPVILTGLENGTRYALQVRATFDDGSTGSSSEERFIPLSPQTLAPLVTNDYMQIRLSWKGISGSDSFDVWRTVKGADAYKKIAAALAATSYVDNGVEFGRDYQYAISPSAARAPMSAPGTGRSLAFPAERLLLVGSAAASGARRVTVSGGYAFVASGAQGVRVIDVSSPAAPTKAGEIATTDAWDVAVRGSYAYVADGEAGLRVLDVSSPRAPLLIGSRRTTDARAVVLSGNFAWIADGVKGLKIINISDARSLPRVGQVDTVNALGLSLQGNLVFLADGPGGLKIFDVSRGGAVPALLGSLSTSDARQVSVQGGLAAVADGASGLRVVDVSNPSRPVLLATFDTGMAVSVAMDAGFAYVADGKTGIKAVNLEDPARPSLFASQPAPGASGISVANRLASIADDAGLELVRVQIQGRSFPVAACDTRGKAFDVSVFGDWAYVASHAQGMRIVNVGDPANVTNASLAASVETRSAESVSLQDNLAYVADGTNGVRILDVSPVWVRSAAGPADVGAYKPGGSVSRVVPAGKYLYVAAGDRGVLVLDVSTPASPALVSSVRSTDASDITLHGNWLYLADGAGGIKILDVADPTHPITLSPGIRGTVRRLALTGTLLVAAFDDGVRIIDVSDPRAPKALGRYGTKTAHAVAADGGFAYVAEGYRGLTVLDLSRPGNPSVVSSCENVFAVGVAIKGEFAIVVDSVGLRVIRVLIPAWLGH
jgi:hypothetical protein